jgi:hypothetical protein
MTRSIGLSRLVTFGNRCHKKGPVTVANPAIHWANFQNPGRAALPENERLPIILDFRIFISLMQ